MEEFNYIVKTAGPDGEIVLGGFDSPENAIMFQRYWVGKNAHWDTPTTAITMYGDRCWIEYPPNYTLLMNDLVIQFLRNQHAE